MIFARQLERLRRAAAVGMPGCPPGKVTVDVRDLRELLHHFDRIEADLRSVYQRARPQCACGDGFTSDAVCANCLCTQAVAVPDGYALVPIEPTREMFKAVDKLDDEMFAGGCAHGANFEQLWEAAILAAPKP